MGRCWSPGCERDDVPPAPGAPHGVQILAAHVTARGTPCADSFSEMYDNEAKQLIWAEAMGPLLEPDEPGLLDVSKVEEILNPPDLEAVLDPEPPPPPKKRKRKS